MILSWNVRGLNRVAKNKEVSSRLFNLNPKVAILLETRVRQNNFDKCKKRLEKKWQVIENYSHSVNGRIWILWDDKRIEVKKISCIDQAIHCGMYNLDGSFIQRLTAIYASNKIEERRKLWLHIEDVGKNQNGAWSLMGDFNNVLNIEDRAGGKDVQETEFVDLRRMMDNIGMFDVERKGDRYTWFNKHTEGAIYSCIDRVLTNIEWLQQNSNRTLHVFDPGVSDHALLFVKDDVNSSKGNKKFKFINQVTEMDGYKTEVNSNWNQPIGGDQVKILWKKLSRLKPVLMKMNKPLMGLKQQIENIRNKLTDAHNNLSHDRMNEQRIKEVKQHTENLLNLQETEEKVLRQRAKVEWIRLGDGNNAFFHASLKSRQKKCGITKLLQEDGTVVHQQEDISNEVLNFYGKLLGETHEKLKSVDIVAIRNGKQLDRIQRAELVKMVEIEEIEAALKSIGDLKAPGVDGFGAKFFKAMWCTVKNDVTRTVLDFFKDGGFDARFNRTLVTLIPKHDQAIKVKDYRPISCCTTVYKIISKVIANRLSKVLGSIISNNQAAFVPSKTIHDHILLAYELIKGYSQMGGMPRCMIQMDIQKAYDSVDWNSLKVILT